MDPTAWLLSWITTTPVRPSRIYRMAAPDWTEEEVRDAIWALVKEGQLRMTPAMTVCRPEETA